MPNWSERLARVAAAMVAAAATVGGMLAIVVATAGAASAHAELAWSNPARESRVSTLPGAVKLSFTEAVGQPAAVSVIGPDGSQLVSGAPKVADRMLTQPLAAPEAAPEGRYAISYQVVSADGHNVSGTVSFVVGSSAGQTAAAGDVPSSAASPRGSPAPAVATLLVGLVVFLSFVTFALSRLVGAGGWTDPPRAGAVPGLVLAAGAAALVTLLLVLQLGGGAPRSAPVGLADAGPLVGWALEIMPLLNTVLGSLTVGIALVSGGYLHRKATIAGVLSATRWLAFAWAASSLLTIALKAVELIRLAPDASVISDLAEAPQVQAGVAQAALAVLAGLATTRVAVAALPLAVAALVPGLLTGHVRTAESPLLAAASLVTHVGAASLWVGGLAALAWVAIRRSTSWLELVPGYSRLALGCFVVVAASGTAVAFTRIGSLDALFTSAYGIVIVLKAVLLGALASLGWLQRRRLIDKQPRGRQPFLLLAGTELTLMVLAFALASGLSQTPPPSGLQEADQVSEASRDSGRPSQENRQDQVASHRELSGLLLAESDLPKEYTAGGGHHHDAGASEAAPQLEEACSPIAELIGTHPSVQQTNHPQASVSFSKSHFGPVVTQTIVDYGSQESATEALARFRGSGESCDRYLQSTSPIGANAYEVEPGQGVGDVERGTFVRLAAVGADFDDLYWDVWAVQSGDQLLALSFRSVPGGGNQELATVIDAAMSKADPR